MATAVLRVVVGQEQQVLWLDEVVRRRYGVRVGDRLVCREAGVQATTLYRIVGRGELPSDAIIDKLARQLDVSVTEFRRCLGIDPITSAVSLGKGERAIYLRALRALVREVQDIAAPPMQRAPLPGFD
jgi:hypothetical protein